MSNNQHSLDELAGNHSYLQAAGVAEVIDRWEMTGRISAQQGAGLRAAAPMLALLPAPDRQRVIGDLLRRNGDPFSNNIALHDTAGNDNHSDSGTDPFLNNVALFPKQEQ